MSIGGLSCSGALCTGNSILLRRENHACSFDRGDLCLMRQRSEFWGGDLDKPIDDKDICAARQKLILVVTSTSRSLHS